jgi:hypothetical protein
MNEVEAAAQLQSIRALMERAALYRRALAPTLLTMGALGCAAALVGWMRPGQSGAAFAGYWLGVAFVAVTAGALLMRRQALRAAEPFWTSPGGHRGDFALDGYLGRRPISSRLAATGLAGILRSGRACRRFFHSARSSLAGRSLRAGGDRTRVVGGLSSRRG